MIIAGNKIYSQCKECLKFVRVNKFILGSMHLCEERESVSDNMRADAQVNYLPPSYNNIGSTFLSELFKNKQD